MVFIACCSYLQFDLGGKREVYLTVSSGLEVSLAHPFDIKFTTKKDKWKSFQVNFPFGWVSGKII